MALWILLAWKNSAGDAVVAAAPWLLIALFVFGVSQLVRPRPSRRVTLAAAYVLLALNFLVIFVLAGATM